MDMLKSFDIVVAATSDGGIGVNGGLPWRLSQDMAFFKEITSKVDNSPNSVTNDVIMKNAVIMGRKTYESIPTKFRPLRDRVNVILSHNSNIRNDLSLDDDDVIIADSLMNALHILSDGPISNNIAKIFVIGGGTVYKEALMSPFCSGIWMTSIENKFEGIDTYFPVISAQLFQLTSRSNINIEKDIKFRFCHFERYVDDFIDMKGDSSSSLSCKYSIFDKFDNNNSHNMNNEEQQYLDCIKDILDNGIVRSDRTGTGTISKFGVQMRFSCRNGNFPLLTTKKVFWRGVAEELLWFLKGSTNAKELSDKKIHIWDGNGSREFLDSRGLSHREEGDLGPVYGFQWRHFGAEYGTMHDDYTGKGVDQLYQCIEKIKTNPTDRRIILTAWNPTDLNKMALPPCHMFCQFYVANGELSCQMYQRSADMGLGVPFNIASYSLLLVMMAQVCDLEPGDFVHTIGDAHVYSNHIDALKEQIQRKPKTFPKIEINPNVHNIDHFTFNDFKIIGYNPDAAIKMKMAV
jgi:dihydrofolate reductase/thymidylate synthase